MFEVIFRAKEQHLVNDLQHCYNKRNIIIKPSTSYELKRFENSPKSA